MGFVAFNSLRVLQILALFEVGISECLPKCCKLLTSIPIEFYIKTLLGARVNIGEMTELFRTFLSFES
jgi:predicted phosphatase